MFHYQEFVLCNLIKKSLLFIGCEQQQMEAARRARAQGSDGATVRIPACNNEGDFETIQCDLSNSNCWCVDSAGFEIPGTRAQDRSLVNCSGKLC